MNRQKKMAKEFVRKYKLCKKSLTAERMKCILESMGFAFHAYNKCGKSSAKVQALLDSLGLSAYSAGKNAFTYISTSDRIIFHHRQLGHDELLYLLIHEAGHIVCGHETYKGLLAYSDVNAEKEANEFAFYVYIYSEKHKNRYAFAVGAAVLLSATVIFSAPAINTPSRSIQKTFSGESKEVYITKSGKRYHNSWCTYIIGKNAAPVTISEAAEAGYTPCSYCKPDTAD